MGTTGRRNRPRGHVTVTEVVCRLRAEVGRPAVVAGRLPRGSVGRLARAYGVHRLTMGHRIAEARRIIATGVRYPHPRALVEDICRLHLACYTNVEIAHQLGVSINVVKGALYQARDEGMVRATRVGKATAPVDHGRIRLLVLGGGGDQEVADLCQVGARTVARTRAALRAEGKLSRQRESGERNHEWTSAT